MTLFEVYKQSIKRLENPDVDEIVVRILLCEINSLKTMSDFYLHKDEEIRDLPRYQSFFDRYLSGEPVQYILGKTEFLDNEFVVNKNVLIPRQESEEVVSFAIKKIQEVFGNQEIDVVDVCCGSGVMGLSLAKKVNVKSLTLSDLSPEAIEVARVNMLKLGINADLCVEDALNAFDKKVDVVISNPPYILKSEKVDKSVLDNEPHLALFADNEFSVYKSIINKLNSIKKDQLLCVFEIGANTRKVLEKYILNTIPNCSYEFIKDMNGKERILSILIK